MGNTNNIPKKKLKLQKLVKNTETGKWYDVFEYTDGSAERIDLSDSSEYYETFSNPNPNTNNVKTKKPNVAQGSKLVFMGGIMRPIPISVISNKK